MSDQIASDPPVNDLSNEELEEYLNQNEDNLSLTSGSTIKSGTGTMQVWVLHFLAGGLVCQKHMATSCAIGFLTKMHKLCPALVFNGLHLWNSRQLIILKHLMPLN